MADSTLQAIRTKIRRITRCPSESQLSTADLDEYINTAILYDFPEELRLFSLRTTFTFYTQPFVDVYESLDPNNIDNNNNPLTNFKNKYIAFHPPLYLAGVPGFYTQWRDVFYGAWPQTNTIAETGLFGDGTQGPFTGTIIGHPMLKNNVIFTCLNANNVGMILIDYPSTADSTQGFLGLPDSNPPPINSIPYGTVNYATGAFSVTFPNNTKPMAPVICENITYQPGKPVAVLYYDTKFTIRPVPDKVYPVQLEADIRPTELLAADQEPQLQQWWQYISYLAAKKIFDDRMDDESNQRIMPELKRQERLVLRATLTQQANERTVTIYTQGKNYGFGADGFGVGGWPY